MEAREAILVCVRHASAPNGYGAKKSDVAASLRLTRQLVQYHVERLAKEGLVAKGKRGVVITAAGDVEAKRILRIEQERPICPVCRQSVPSAT